VIQIGFGVGNDSLGVIQPLGVDVGECHDVGVGQGDRLADQLHAAIARADQAEPNPVVRA